MMRAMSAPPITVDVPLRWSDMDALGHVNNVQYLRLLEVARIHGLGLWFGLQERPVTGELLVARNEIDYLAPLVYRAEPICIDMWVTAVSGASFDVGYVVRDPEALGGRHYARAETTLVAFDPQAQQARRWSDDEREHLLAALSEPVPMRRRRSGRS